MPGDRVEKLQALTPEQLTALNGAKVAIRMDNEHYLRDHPDAARLVRALMRGIIRDRPVNVSAYTHRFFARPDAAIRRDMGAID
ncbi:hypothetical protein P43SY_000545 [Pythium insidiosum]|uniref:Uncharacterized protein n=1 Tax=Pythium insidiosum TaxID=114742 RepID=A0AAD5Q532_PYTIN|nr:hypothetical protein P43SY_000545 [Pythium insidiosum]